MFFVPKELKKCKNWLVWKLQDNKKIPINPLTGRYADATTTKYCTDYETALNVLCNTDLYNGLGFVISSNCPYTFIDLDHCINSSGEYSHFALEVLEMFSNCYAEISQSEKGLHIITKGKGLYNIKMPFLEVYSCKRYVALTGNAINNNEPQDGQLAINTLINKYGKNNKDNYKQSLKKPLKAFKTPLNTQEVIKNIKQSYNYEKWLGLYKGEYGNEYPTTSEAFQSFINITGYYTGYDYDLVSLIVNKSYFKDTKHAGEYYIKLSLEKALKGANKVPMTTYKTTTSKKLKDDFYKTYYPREYAEEKRKKPLW